MSAKLNNSKKSSLVDLSKYSEKQSLKMEKIDPIEKRHYKGNINSDIIMFPNELTNNYLSVKANEAVINMPIYSFRIIWKILNDVSYDQFNKDNKEQKSQLNLFEEEFKTSHNTYARFSFKIKDISEKRDNENIWKGLKFLADYMRGTYVTMNKKGKPIRSYGGLISEPQMSDGKISFLVSSYWFEKLVNMKPYNESYLKIPWVLNNGKHMLFWLWLLKVEGKTKFKLDEFQKQFKYNYSTTKDLVKNVFKVIKEKLDTHANKSFNYNVDGNIIHIQIYYPKKTDIKVKKKTLTKQKVTQRLHYWKTQFNLTEDNIKSMRHLIAMDKTTYLILDKSYINMVKDYRNRKEKVSDLQKDDFLNEFQKYIIEYYNKSHWKNVIKDGYPKIV